MGEASTNDRPVLGGDRAGTDLARPLLQLSDPCLVSVDIRAFVETQQKFVGNAGALPHG